MKIDDPNINILAVSLLSALDKEKVIDPILQWIREEIPKHRISYYSWNYHVLFAIENLSATKEFFFEVINEPFWFVNQLEIYEGIDDWVEEALDDKRYRNLVAIAFGEYWDSIPNEALYEALQDTDKRVRWRAAEVLKQIGDSRIVSVLVDALHDTDSNLSVLDKLLRWEAAQAL